MSTLHEFLNSFLIRIYIIMDFIISGLYVRRQRFRDEKKFELPSFSKFMNVTIMIHILLKK